MTRALISAFEKQAGACEQLDSPFMGRLFRLLAARWRSDFVMSDRYAAWEGDLGPSGASLPLRLAGGLHALVLSGKSPRLTDAYPPNDVDDETLWQAVAEALSTDASFWDAWLTQAPQTNEVRRATAMIAASHWLNQHCPLPLRVSELGASGGLNLMFDRFHLQAGGQTFGPRSDVLLQPDWRGPVPVPASPTIAERRGVDIHPIDTSDPAQRLRLLSYLWPDQQSRAQRTRAAIALQDAEVDKAQAIDWLETRLPAVSGQLHLIYHTIAWQYFPQSEQERGKAMIEAAGATATPHTPLAWLRMEADGQSPGASLTMRLWPGDLTVNLGRIDFHGRWIDWQAPTRVDWL